VLSILLRFIDYDYPFGIFKLYLNILKNISHNQIFVCVIIHLFSLMTGTLMSPAVLLFFNARKASIHIYIYIWYHVENKLPFEKGLRRHHDLINHSENFCHKCLRRHHDLINHSENFCHKCTVCRYNNRELFSSFFVWMMNPEIQQRVVFAKMIKPDSIPGNNDWSMHKARYIVHIYFHTLGELWRFVLPKNVVFTTIIVRVKHDCSTCLYFI